MDIWHWTSLVVLLCYSSLTTIPAAFYQSAAIDGASRWKVFYYIELPKMKSILHPHTLLILYTCLIERKKIPVMMLIKNDGGYI